MQKESTPHGIHSVAKPMGPACNHACYYCSYLEKKTLIANGENFRISDKILSNFRK